MLRMLRVMPLLIPLLMLIATPFLADVIGPGGKLRDCCCTDSAGGRVELGDIICPHVDGRMFMAQCQMSLHLPIRREVQQGCLSSRLEISKPPLDPDLVHPKI